MMVVGYFVIMSLFVVARRAVTWLATWEANWRGMRLPGPVVKRVMDFHVAHLMPVCLLIMSVVIGGHVMFHLRLGGPEGFFGYLIALCVATIGGAVWLFWTFWLAMSNMLRANV